MLNFGPLAAALAFAILGCFVQRVRHMLTTLRPEDARFLLYPVLINLSFVLLVSDSDNVVFFFLKNGALPFLVIALSARRMRVSAPPRRSNTKERAPILMQDGAPASAGRAWGPTP